VDGVATFAAPGRVIIEGSEDDDDPRRPYFDALRDALDGQTDARGRPLELVTLPEAPWDVSRGERFCCSYVNFYIANGAIIAPSYGIDLDDAVRERLQALFPTRRIVHGADHRHRRWRRRHPLHHAAAAEGRVDRFPGAAGADLTQNCPSTVVRPSASQSSMPPR
jgi:hypothetical protein